MKIPRQNRISLIVILLICLLVITGKISDKNLGNKGNFGVIDWDNFGYYLYLPATFIYEDLKLQDASWVYEVQKKYNLSKSYYQAHHIHNGNRVIQYTSGMAIFYSPSFIIGHIIALNSSYEADGFSFPYQIVILLQSFLMVFLGLFYLRKLSLFYFSDKLSALVILTICIGTNYFQIAAANISSPHIYLFFLYALALYLIGKWHDSPSLKDSFLIGIICALMVLSRASEILFLIVPVLWRSGQLNTYKEKLNFLLTNKKHLIALGIPFMVLGIIQPLYWNYVSGEWIFDSYTNEGFKLLKPYIIEYLFSYKKGWLLYTPIMIFGIFGFIAFIKIKKSIALPLFAFLIVYVWLLSSWDCWWYASSFSQRSIVQAYPIFILPFGYLYLSFKNIPKLIKVTLSLIIVLLVTLNLIQTYQFKKYILHPDRMTKEYYWNSFLVFDKNIPNRELLEPDRSINYLPEEKPKSHTLVYYESFENESLSDNTNVLLQEEGVLTLDKNKPFSKNIKFAITDLTDTSYCYVIFRFRFKSDFTQSQSKLAIESRMIDSYNGNYYDYRRRGIEGISWFEKGSWSSMDMVIIPSILRNLDDSVQFNLAYKGNDSVLIDNISIEVLDYANIQKQKVKNYINDFHTLKIGDWSNTKNTLGERGYHYIDSLNEYSSTLTIPLSDLHSQRNISLNAKVLFESENIDSYAVASISNTNDSIIYYKAFPIQKDDNDWEDLNIDYTLPENIEENSMLKLYLWNKSADKVLIRHFKVDLK